MFAGLIYIENYKRTCPFWLSLIGFQSETRKEISDFDCGSLSTLRGKTSFHYLQHLLIGPEHRKGNYTRVYRVQTIICLACSETFMLINERTGIQKWSSGFSLSLLLL